MWVRYSKADGTYSKWHYEYHGGTYCGRGLPMSGVIRVTRKPAEPANKVCQTCKNVPFASLL